MRERSPTCYILAKTIENWDEEIFPRIQSLADHPDMGRLEPELDQTFLGVSSPHIARRRTRNDRYGAVLQAITAKQRGSILLQFVRVVL